MEDINLKGGVLIIGSLLWQKHLKSEDEDNIREDWRENNLLLDQKIMVKVPIRYGRCSQSKTNTQSGIYTMVFSNSCEKNKLGTGYFVPFKKLLATFDDIIKEAGELSVAEGMPAGRLLSKESGTQNVWCSIGLLFNPNTVEKKEKAAIIEKWSSKIASQGTLTPKDFKVGRERTCIDKDGTLNFDWIKPVDKRQTETLNDYDIILVTATAPKPKSYPSIDELVKNVERETERYYFIENYKAGITTFQDLRVLNKL